MDGVKVTVTERGCYVVRCGGCGFELGSSRVGRGPKGPVGVARRSVEQWGYECPLCHRSFDRKG